MRVETHHFLVVNFVSAADFALGRLAEAMSDFGFPSGDDRTERGRFRGPDFSNLFCILL